MLPTKFRFVWPNGFRGEESKKSELAKIIWSDRQNNGRSDQLMNRVCPNVRHENITLWSSSWRLKFINSQFPLPLALNSVLLKCQTET